MKTVFAFSGQGSQYYQMAGGLMKHHTFFKEKMVALDHMAKAINGISILEVIYGNHKSLPFTRLVHTYPAVFMLEQALSTTLIEAEGIQPDYVVGASMGEFAAAVTAGIIDEATALETLIAHGTEVERVLTPKQGGMLSILKGIEFFENTPWLKANSELAAINTPQHITVAGTTQSLGLIKKHLKQASIDFLDIPVDYAFHSGELNPLKAFSIDLVKKMRLMPPKIPFVSGVKGKQINHLSPPYFWEVVRQPIQYQAAVMAIEADKSPKTYLDLGPSGTLAAFTKQILSQGNQNQSQAMPIVNMFGTEWQNLNQIRKHFNTPTGTKQAMIKDNSTACLFPGQGSQKIGMGKALFEKYPNETAKASEILGYAIESLCLESTAKKLSQTQYTQPALYVVDCLSYLDHKATTGKTPAYVVGHSLGEYAALFAAGVYDFETGLRLVQKRGELMSKIENGGMAAIIGLSAEEVKSFLTDNHFDDIDLANINTPTQNVISGPRNRMDELNKVFNAKLADKQRAFVPINTSGAFHSRYMQQASEAFTQYLQGFTYQSPKIPVISNAETNFYTQENTVGLLSKQLVQPVRWVETIQLLKCMGVENFEECGPGEVLTKLVGSIVKRPIPEAMQARADVMKQQPTIVKQSLSPSTNGTPKPQNQNNSGVTSHPQKQPGMALGSSRFKNAYGVQYAYMVGGLQGGAVSLEMLDAMRANHMLCFVGTSMVPMAQVADTVKAAGKKGMSTPFGLTVMYDQLIPQKEQQALELAVENQVPYIEAVGYLQPTAALVKYKYSRLTKLDNGQATSPHKLFVRVSRPEIAQIFLAPPSQKIIAQLVNEGAITTAQATMAAHMPVADELIVEGNSGWSFMEYAPEVLMPLMKSLRDGLYHEHQLHLKTGIGMAGEIGSPHTAVTAFMQGAEFIVAESVNYCTKEAHISSVAKTMLQNAGVQDVEYAPSFHQFELGGKIKVLRKGVFYPARARKLYELYQTYPSIEDLPTKEVEKLEERYLKTSLSNAWEEALSLFNIPKEEALKKVASSPKFKMAMIFRWYLWRGWAAACKGEQAYKVNYQICSAPAMGACNHWLTGSDMESWENRPVATLAMKIMGDTEKMAHQQTQQLQKALDTEKFSV